ncbi:MAG: hypothetical protein ABI210_12110, partial [Abditibacteriaceae bacterium]
SINQARCATVAFFCDDTHWIKDNIKCLGERIAMIYEELEGKTFSLLITDYTANKDVYVLNGIVTRQENEFVLIYDKERRPFPLIREWEEKIQSVKSDVRDIFKTDYFMSLTLGKRTTNL